MTGHGESGADSCKYRQQIELLGVSSSALMLAKGCWFEPMNEHKNLKIRNKGFFPDVPHAAIKGQ